MAKPINKERVIRDPKLRATALQAAKNAARTKLMAGKTEEALPAAREAIEQTMLTAK